MSAPAKRNKPRAANDPAELRRRAELRLESQRTKTTPSQTEADNQRHLHELEVHQIELELQNEELRDAREATEALLEKYTDLYDFAPVPYVTFCDHGVIREIKSTKRG